jgi:hypothetical protein
MHIRAHQNKDDDEEFWEQTKHPLESIAEVGSMPYMGRILVEAAVQENPENGLWAGAVIGSENR